MAEMTRDEWRTFLREPARPAMLATVRPDGRPHVAPIWMLPWATRIGGRYTGGDRAEAFGRRNAVEGELLVRVTPTRVVARKNISD